MHVGFADLKLSPAQFWSLTPRELKAALSSPAHALAETLSSRDLAGLMARFPDAKKDGPDGTIV